MFDKLSPNMKAALVTIAVTLLLAIVGGAYKIGYDVGAKDLDEINDFRKANLPQLIDNLGTLSKDFRERADLVKEFEKTASKVRELDAGNKQLNIENDNLKKKISQSDALIDDLKKRLKLNFPKKEVTIKVSIGESQTVIPNVLRIGYSLSTHSWARITLNGKESKEIPVGGSETIDIAGVICKIEIVSSTSVTYEALVSCADK